MEMPNTGDELLEIFSQNTPIDEGRIFACKRCGHRAWYAEMHGIQYVPRGEKPKLEHYWYYCKKCMDKRLWDFIIAKAIDVRILKPYEIDQLERAYYDGRYDAWLIERGQNRLN